jgi:hypothetical protein
MKQKDHKIAHVGNPTRVCQASDFTHNLKFARDSLKAEKPLDLASRLEPAHLRFPVVGRLMRGFGAIVGVTFRVMSHIA